MKNMSNTEREIMEIIWTHLGGKTTLEPLLHALNVGPLFRESDRVKDWISSTTVSFLSRLVEKGYLTVCKKGRKNLYISTITREQYVEEETQKFVKQIYSDQPDKLILALRKMYHLK